MESTVISTMYQRALEEHTRKSIKDWLKKILDIKKIRNYKWNTTTCKIKIYLGV